MLTQIELTPLLGRFLEEVCARNSPSCGYGYCRQACNSAKGECQLETLDVRIETGVYRDLDCQHCLLVLALTAIDRHVSYDDQQVWLETPNLDLHGRSPKDCLEAGDYEAVFQSLWMLEDSPVSTG